MRRAASFVLVCLASLASTGCRSVEPDALDVRAAINTTCPRSGKPVVASSLTEYRGFIVGFCNQHCRDDFATDPEACPDDRAYFDALIEQAQGE